MSWSEQKQISFNFRPSCFTCRQPVDVLIPNSAARRSSSDEKHRRLDFKIVAFRWRRAKRFPVQLPFSIPSGKSTDFQHLPSHGSNLCWVKSNSAWQSETKKKRKIEKIDQRHVVFLPSRKTPLISSGDCRVTSQRQHRREISSAKFNENVSRKRINLIDIVIRSIESVSSVWYRKKKRSKVIVYWRSKWPRRLRSSNDVHSLHYHWFIQSTSIDIIIRD